MSAEPKPANDPTSVEMPTPTVAPLVMSLGIALMAMGVATGSVFLIVGAVLFVLGLGTWIGHLLPGQGHRDEALVAPAGRPQPVIAVAGAVQQIRPGMPGYRLRLPERVHPISAGIKGGIVGGLVMPLPAIAYCLLSGRGIWLPVNLLAGMVLPGVGDRSLDALEKFDPTLLVIGTSIHVSVSLTLGLLYGVLMPMLPKVRKPLAWGAILMPLFWTALSFVALGVFNPSVRARVDWPWFMVSQFIFGMVAAVVFIRLEKRNPITAGALCGIAGGLLMPIPAFVWAVLSNHTIWYPVNLLSAMAMRHTAEMSVAELDQFHSDWLVAAIAAHALLSISFGLAFALVLPRVPAIPAPIVWGGLIMPLMWTASSYGLMGVVNPLLQEYVDWPWFVASQFVFGVVAAIVVVRSEQIRIEPAGRGPDRLAA
jgi:hypothetical protein